MFVGQCNVQTFYSRWDFVPCQVYRRLDFEWRSQLHPCDHPVIFWYPVGRIIDGYLYTYFYSILDASMWRWSVDGSLWRLWESFLKSCIATRLKYRDPSLFSCSFRFCFLLYFLPSPSCSAHREMGDNSTEAGLLQQLPNPLTPMAFFPPDLAFQVTISSYIVVGACGVSLGQI